MENRKTDEVSGEEKEKKKKPTLDIFQSDKKKTENCYKEKYVHIIQIVFSVSL